MRSSALFINLLRLLPVMLSCLAGPATADPVATAGPLEVIAVIPRDSPPEYQLDEGDRPGGFAVELMALIAQRAGLKVTYRVEDSWDKTIQSLREGRADLIPNLGITEARKKEFGFTSPFETFRVSLFVRNDTYDVRGLTDLAGRRVAVVRANAAEAILRAHAEIRLETYADFPDALFALLSGNVDALAYPEPWAWKRAQGARVADQIKVAGEPLAELKRGLAVLATRQALLERIDKAVQHVLTTPEYREIYAKWLGQEQPFWTPARLGWASGFVLALTILGMAAWRYQSTARAYRDLKAAQAEQNHIEARRQTVFETTPVSLWEEDITEVRRLIESRRAEVFSGWDNYFQEHPELVTECARMLRVVDVNKAAVRLYEAASKEHLLGSIEQIFTDKSYEVFKNELVAIAEGRRHFSAETVNRTLRGKEIIILLSVSIPPPELLSQRMVAAVLDVTEQKRAREALRQNEQKFRAIINASPVPYALNDDQQNIIFLNPEFVRSFGYTREDIPTLADWWPKAYPDPEYRHWVMSAWRAHLEKAKRENTAFEPLELTIQCKDGTHRTVLAGAAALGESWEGAHLVILYDISDRKQTETERERLLEEIAQRNIEMENFVYTISHDLKSPLITIDGFAKLLAKDLERGDKERGRDSIGEIRKASEGMQQLIEELLQLSRTGHIQGEPEDVDLDALLGDIRARCASHIERERATIRVASPLPRLHVDRGRFGQVLQNLLDNGVKFHRQGVDPVLEIGARQDDGEARIYVRDNGIGIEKPYQEKIFGLFQRLDTSREGTGVGLTIARRIVELHGGRLWVESEPGKGSTFWISLPESAIVADGARHSARENRSPR